MSLYGLLRRCRGRHADHAFRAEVEGLTTEAAAAIAGIDARRDRPADRLVRSLCTTIGSPAISEAADRKLAEIERGNHEKGRL